MSRQDSRKFPASPQRCDVQKGYRRPSSSGCSRQGEGRVQPRRSKEKKQRPPKKEIYAIRTRIFDPLWLNWGQFTGLLVFFVGFLVVWEFYHQQHISFLGCEKETPKSWQPGMFYWKFLSISRSEVPNSSVIPQTNTGWLIMLLINVNHITIIYIYMYIDDVNNGW